MAEDDKAVDADAATREKSELQTVEDDYAKETTRRQLEQQKEEQEK